jgi:hypothetical protein
VQDADVAFYECTVQGGAGGGGSVVCGYLGDGGVGLDVLDARVLLSGGTILGGGTTNGAAGSGVRGDVLSEILVLDSTVQGGAGGLDFETAPGTLSTLGGTTRSFALDSPLRELQAGTLSMQGVQGDFVGFFWSFGSGSLPMPARNGWFVLNPAQLGGPFFIGAITDPGGAWDIPITAPLLLPAFEAQTFFLQAWFQSPGGVTLGSGTSLTVVDQAF